MTRLSGLPLRERCEIAAAVATGALHPVFVDVLHLKGVFIAIALAGWIAYLVSRVRARRELPAEWGLTAAGLRPTFVAASLAALVVAAAMAAIASRNGHVALHPHMLPLLVLYPVWGLFQQLLVQGIVVRPLALGDPPVASRTFTVALAAALFGAIHLPDLTLAAATAGMGIVFTPIYLRWRNLWPLGLFHGWLGVAFYFWVLGRDPWAEVFAGAG